MQTGEGKTLAAVMPASSARSPAAGVHVLTFNDYLARRDAEWMGPVYRALGLSVDWIGGGRPPGERRRAYAADVTYVTAKEAGFDHLRDLLARDAGRARAPPVPLRARRRGGLAAGGRSARPAGDRRQRARARPRPRGGWRELVAGARAGPALRHRRVRAQRRAHGGGDRAGRAGARLREPALRTRNYTLLTELHCALHARALLHRDADYIVRDGRIQIVDEFTGRVVEDRHWPDGLQAALEAKEGLERRPDGRILGSMTLQHFLRSLPAPVRHDGHGARRPRARSTSSTACPWWWSRPTVPDPGRRAPTSSSPTARPRRRRWWTRSGGPTPRGRPVLVGTLTIAESERLAARLRAHGRALRGAQRHPRREGGRASSARRARRAR